MVTKRKVLLLLLASTNAAYAADVPEHLWCQHECIRECYADPVCAIDCVGGCDCDGNNVEDWIDLTWTQAGCPIHDDVNCDGVPDVCQDEWMFGPACAQSDLHDLCIVDGDCSDLVPDSPLAEVLILGHEDDENTEQPSRVADRQDDMLWADHAMGVWRGVSEKLTGEMECEVCPPARGELDGQPLAFR